LMPSSSSAATMKLTYAKESQFGTSCRCVCIVSTTAPSESRSPRMRPNTSKSSSSVMLGRLPGDVGSNGDVLLQIEHPPCRTLGQRCHIVYFGESQIWIEAADYAILRRRQAVRDESPRTAASGDLDRDGHGFEFELSPEHTTAHDPTGDIENVGLPWLRPEKHRADEAIIAEPVKQPERERDVLRGPRNRLQLLARAAPSGRIELVGLVDQLRHPDNIERRQRPEHHRHLKPAKEVVHAAGGCEHGVAFRIGSVLRRAMSIVGRKAHRLEISGGGKASRVMAGIIRQLRNRDHRQRLADASALHRAVIEEDYAIEADVKLARDGRQVLRFVFPIRHEHGDVTPPEDHLGMTIEGRLGRRQVVLRANRQDDATVFELLDIALNGEMRLAERATLAQHDALDSIIAQHAAPQRVVEIEDKAFLRKTALRGNDSSDQLARERRRRRRDLELALQPAHGVKP